jgi:sensor histidine kinase YesM
MLLLFWVNEKLFHGYAAIVSKHSIISISIASWIGWMLQYLLLSPIRYDNRKKLYHPRVALIYLLVVIVIPFIPELLFCSGRYVENGFSDLHNADFELSIRLVSLSIIANLSLDALLLSKQKLISDLQLQEYELKKRDIELAIFKAQLNPHFIYNSLNALSYLASKNPEQVVHYSKRFADIYEFMLTYINTDWVNLKDEIGLVNKYLEMENLRNSQSAILQHTIDEKTANSWQIVPFSLQLLIENALKHNMHSKEHPLEISLTIEAPSIVVKNRLKPYSTKHKSTGIGLSNLKQRYKLISNEEIYVYEANDDFFVKLPMKKTV